MRNSLQSIDASECDREGGNYKLPVVGLTVLNIGEVLGNRHFLWCKSGGGVRGEGVITDCTEPDTGSHSMFTTFNVCSFEDEEFPRDCGPKSDKERVKLDLLDCCSSIADISMRGMSFSTNESASSSSHTILLLGLFVLPSGSWLLSDLISSSIKLSSMICEGAVDCSSSL